jgi:acyl transferase domain-containing protein/NAD(P)-dependent dehydrogenase (short-subunit alcohol dehydrogenase family)
MNPKTSSVSIAVIGMGCWYPGASSPRELWENILTKRRQFRRTPDNRLPLSEYYDSDPSFPDKTYVNRMAVIDGFRFDWVNKRIPKSTFESTDIVHWLALEIADKALLDAGYTRESVPSEKTGVIVGNTLTGEISRTTSLRLRWPYIRRALREAAQNKLDPERLSEIERQMEWYIKSSLPEINEDSLAGFLSNTIAGRICNFFNFKGGGYTVDGACSSSLIALATAAQSLVNKNLDLAVAGGVDISLDPFELVGFAKTKALTSKEMTVYDRRASGFIPGEGCGFVVLKRLEDARADQNYVYAVLRGWGISSDGAGVGITAPSGSGQSIALNRAYELAGYSPRELAFIEGHGTGTKVGDIAELKGIALAMDVKDEEKRFCGVTSFKSLVGHTKAAAGIGGFIKAVMAVNRRVLPPMAGGKEPNDEFANSARCLYPIIQGECRQITEILRAGVSAMGFGGSNSHVTLESGDAPSPKLQPSISERSLLVSHQETELFVFNALSAEDLSKQARQLREVAPNLSIAELVDLAADLVTRVNHQNPIRATIIAGSPDELVDNLQILEQMLTQTPPNPGEVVVNPQKTVGIGNAVKQCRVGFLFPGQGSQLLNMTHVLVERYPWARELVNQSDTWLNDLGCPSVRQLIYRPLDRAVNKEQIDEWKNILAQTQIAQPSICLSSLIWIRYLQRLGINPVAVGGHSLGELTAFYAAGAFDEKTLLSLAAVRGRAMSVSTDRAGVMASLACSRTQAENLLQEVSSGIVVANINSPTQVVISGERVSVEKVIELANAQSIQTHVLKVSNAFHSPFVEPAAQELRIHAPVPEKLGQTTRPLFSSVNGKQVYAGIKLREHFAYQVTAQVDFVSLVKSISSECDLLVEVGPGRVLSSLVASINSDGGPPCLPLEGKTAQDKDVNTVLATIFLNGGEINWQVLYENRLVRSFVPPSERIFIENPCELPFREVDGSLYKEPSASEDWIKSLSNENINISPSQLSNYLSQRGKFIEQVILADLQNLPYALAPQNGYIQTKNSELPEQKEKAGVKVNLKKDVQSILVELIAKETGFPTESISLDCRLLDDLNLESIKAGEIIAATATECGVAGKIDPASLANSTLQSVVEALRNVMGNSQEEFETVASAKPEEIISRQNNWVRNFIIKYIPEAIPQDIPEPQWEDIWANAYVLIICEPTEAEIAEEISHSLQQTGDTLIKTVSFMELNNQSIIGNAEFSHVIAILPRKSNTNHFLSDHLPVQVDRLRSVAVSLPFRDELKKQRVMTYIQFGGGYFGTQQPILDIESYCATAFAASIHMERPDLKVRVIDFAPNVRAAQLAQRVISEISTLDNYAAIGYTAEMIRQIPRPFVQERTNYKNRSINWSADDVILVTGGAKGITAECAFALAQSTGVQMALVGSSPFDIDKSEMGVNEIAQTLNRFSSHGLNCRYYQCNVADLESVKDLLHRVEQDMGEISGVIHGAAINKPRMVDKVSTEEALKEIGPKLKGIINLCQAFQNKCIKIFVGFASQGGLSGISRNAWYCFSNEAMSILLRRFHSEHPETAVISIAYGIWEEKGMGVNTGAHQYMLQQGYGAISINEGIHRFVELFQKNPEDSQVAVIARLNNTFSDTWKPLVTDFIPRASRFLEQVVYLYPGIQIVSRVNLNLERDFYLKDHIYKGSYLFPTVFGLEAMAQAVAYVTKTEKFNALRIENISLKQAITVNPEKGTTIEIYAEVLEPESNDGLLRIQTGIKTEQTGFVSDHFSATFVLGIATEAPVEYIEFTKNALDIRPEEDLYGSLLFHGPLFQRLKQFYMLKHRYVVFSIERRSQNYNDFSETTSEQWLLGDSLFPRCSTSGRPSDYSSRYMSSYWNR